MKATDAFPGFKTVGRPLPGGRLLDSKVEQPTTPKEVVDSKMLDKILEALHQEPDVYIPVSDVGIAKVPFNRKKTITYLKFLQFYLKLQLSTVEKELQRLEDEELNADDSNQFGPDTTENK